jgi:flagellin
MALGVLNNLSAIYAENNLNNTNSSLQTVLQQLSSGSKINSGADDAAGLSLVNGLAANSAALTQSETNATEGVGLLDVADGALSQVTSLLDRAITLATEASNGTLNSTQDSAANQEYTSIMSEVNNIGSTTTYNQQQVFTGNTVAIYTGDSSTAGSSVDDLNIRTLSESSIGDTNGAMSYSTGQDNLFIDLSNDGKNAALTDSLGAPTATTTITVSYLSKGAGGSATTSTANISVGAGTSYSNTAADLISAIDNSGLGLNATFTTAAQAGSAAKAAAAAANDGGGSGTDTGIEISADGIGTGSNGVGVVGALALPSGDTLGGTLNIVGTDGHSHNIALGTPNSTDTLANLESTINAAGYGVTASLNTTPVNGHAAGTLLTFTTADPAVIISGNGLTQTAPAGVPTSISLLDTPTDNAANSTTLGTVNILSTDTLSGSLVIGSSTLAIGATDNTAATLLTAINNGDYGVTAAYNATTGVMTFTSLNPSLVVNTSSLDEAAGLGAPAPVGALTASNTTSSGYYSIGITGTVLDTSTAGGGTANVGLTTDVDGTNGTATTSYSDDAGEALNGTDLSNQIDAETALNDLNLAISDVAAQDGYIGAQINTLNSVSQVMTTQQENVVSAQNAIQATDYASATSNMSKYEILSQTGIAALAQANSVQQEVTKLLQ